MSAPATRAPLKLTTPSLVGAAPPLKKEAPAPVAPNSAGPGFELAAGNAANSSEPGPTGNAVSKEHAAANAAGGLLRGAGTAFGFLGTGTYRASLEQKLGKDLGYFTIDSVTAEGEAKLEFGGDQMRDPNEAMTFGKADNQIKFGFIGENKETRSTGATKYTPGVELEFKHKVDEHLPKLVQWLIPNKAKAKATTDGGEVSAEWDALREIGLENGLGDLTFKFKVIDKKWGEAIEFMNLEAQFKTKNISIPISFLGGQVGNIMITVALKIKIKPNYGFIVASLGGAMETAVILGVVAIPVVTWYSAFMTMQEGDAVVTLTSLGGPIETARDFAYSYWATWNGRSPRESLFGGAGAEAARARMPDPDSQSKANLPHLARDLYGEGWDMVWPSVRAGIERDYFEAYGGSRTGGSGSLLVRTLDSIERHKGR